ncbi:L,D-transpeptidase family protein [Methylocapsa palsarum]|uniref:L,D-peptidoglycan transpeptidase YkuD, ErfK/YbiS/YcfS/YnhG family n=1 Tax=Methylocapsa palsarum TaxID=1612308 RepID=A0A1I4AH03_9HYPH|nr:L,D-transpeptidase family protein [Methylocapsa palsarum]SFK55742.1 L,D-peptidoglycan transpeptidase YkuD, ErfK/YbiS/YcfS/YnhG family [Methylocapsa palsarum]
MKSLKKTPVVPTAGKTRRNPAGLTRLVATLAQTQAGAQKFRTGRLHAGSMVIRCALGAAGVTHAKREGDHASPAGHWRLVGGYFRADRIKRGRTPLAMRPVSPHMGWCDDPGSPAYNKMVLSPFRASHEKLWRDDPLYDVVIVLDYNIHPRRKGRGSAIFLHCARPDAAPTEGCVAISADDLRRLLPRLSPRTMLVIR